MVLVVRRSPHHFSDEAVTAQMDCSTGDRYVSHFARWVGAVFAVTVGILLVTHGWILVDGIGSVRYPQKRFTRIDSNERSRCRVTSESRERHRAAGRSVAAQVSRHRTNDTLQTISHVFRCYFGVVTNQV